MRGSTLTTPVLAAAAAAFLVGCSEGGTVGPEGPQPPQGPEAPSSAQLQSIPSSQAGVVQVCKEAATAGDFDFTVTQDGSEGTIPVSSPFTLAAGDCATVWTDDAETMPSDPLTVVTVTELVPTGWQLDDIQILGDAVSSTKDLTTGVSTVTVNAFHGAVIVYTNSEVFVPGNEGCTPGFWKNNVGQWDDTGFDPSDDFDTTFGVDLFAPDITLLDALKLHGGKEKAMARHAVAALLNAADPEVDAALSQSEVIQIVQDAVASGDFNAAKDQLEAANELGCPLSADESQK